jgi:hypothetical protein
MEFILKEKEDYIERLAFMNSNKEYIHLESL